MLDDPFATWFAARGWRPHPHQLDLLAIADAPAALLIAPTGGGKTLAGFLPTLTELGPNPPPGLHTVYVSPLKALAADIRRNLEWPVEEMGLAIRVEDRTGDTSQSKRQRQRTDPPHILLTTPESLALLISYEDAPRIFAGLQRIVIDEIHALAESKRGDQLMLALARLQRLAPGLRRVGLSATVDSPEDIARFMAPDARILHADPGPPADIAMLPTREPPPWAGAGGRYAVRDIYDQILAHGTTLVFINTRAQAELFLQAIWAINDQALPIGLHHGSLSREARERVEAAMVAGQMRAIVCTGSLDLGIDWGNVDLVIQVGGPKNVKRLVQRIGRANHRYNAPSKAWLVPANRFEVIECIAALEAVAEGDLDRDPRRDGPLDLLCQHILICAASAPFAAEELFTEIRTAGPYRNLDRATFDRCLAFCATGGYALRAYDRYQRLIERDGRWQLRDPRSARAIRMNIGTITGTETLDVRWKARRGGGGKPLGEVEERFAETLTPGDSFLIGGQVVRFEGMREMVLEVSKTGSREPKIAVFGGTKLAMSTVLSHRVQRILADPDRWRELPAPIADWLRIQTEVSRLPAPGRLMAESFKRGDRAFLAVYGFAGRNAQQTLGILMTKRMEDAGLDPLGFLSTDHATLIWGLTEVEDVRPLLEPGDLRAGLDGWLAENAVMKRTFRSAALVAGLIERTLPGKRKTGKQATFSSDILYDTLRRFDPGHLMLDITRIEAMSGLVDFDRIERMLAEADRIDHVRPGRVTPLAAPLLLEAGRVPIMGLAEERLLDEEAARMMAEAGLA